VPRYPDQAAAVQQSVRDSGFAAAALTEIDHRAAIGHAGQAGGFGAGGAGVGVGVGQAEAVPPVIVVDTIGELRALYAAADIAFVGGSLYYRGSNKGGHNLMEPAIVGLPVIFGPHNVSFRETVQDLLAADAGIEVRDRNDLQRALEELVGSAERRTGMGRRAREVVLAGQGATVRNLALLLPLIDRAQSCSASPDAAQCRQQSRGQMLNE
jgi:3-deoxy-D-manno-octulosonic-acid transferase